MLVSDSRLTEAADNRKAKGACVGTRIHWKKCRVRDGCFLMTDLEST